MGEQYRDHRWVDGPTLSREARDDLLLQEQWELLVPSGADVAAIAERLGTADHPFEESSSGLLTADPWQTRMRVTVAS